MLNDPSDPRYVDKQRQLMSFDHQESEIAGRCDGSFDVVSPQPETWDQRLGWLEPIYDAAAEQLILSPDVLKQLEQTGWEVWALANPYHGARSFELRNYQRGIPYLRAVRAIKADTGKASGFLGNGQDALLLDLNGCSFYVSPEEEAVLTDLCSPAGCRAKGLSPGEQHTIDIILDGGPLHGQKVNIISSVYAPPAEAPIVTSATGTVRSNDLDKLDYEGFFDPMVLEAYARYMHVNRIQPDGKLRASDNWQNGLELGRWMKSAVRHFQDIWKGWRGYPVEEGELAACAGTLFNIMGFMRERMATDPQWLDRELAKYKVFREKELESRR